MQFDVYANPSSKLSEQYPFVVDVQSNLISALATRMVVPLATTKLKIDELPHRLCPLIDVNKRSLMLVPFEAAPLPKRLLKKKVISAKQHANEIIAAMDAVISGF